MIKILTTRLQIFFIICVIIFIISILRMVIKKNLELKYSLLWLFCAGILLILAIFPKLLTVISELMSVYSEVNALFILAFLFVATILFSLTIALSRSSKRIRALTQEIALLNKRMENQ